MSQNMRHQPKSEPTYTDLDLCTNCGHRYGEHAARHCEGWTKGNNDGCSCPIYMPEVTLIPEETIFPDMLVASPVGTAPLSVRPVNEAPNGSRPMFTQKHFDKIAHVLAQEGNAIVNVAASVFASNYDEPANLDRPGYSYLEALRNLEGRIHEWQCTANMLGWMLLDANKSFQWEKFKQGINAYVMNELYSRTLSEIKQQQAKGSN